VRNHRVGVNPFLTAAWLVLVTIGVGVNSTWAGSDDRISCDGVVHPAHSTGVLTHPITFPRLSITPTAPLSRRYFALQATIPDTQACAILCIQVIRHLRQSNPGIPAEDLETLLNKCVVCCYSTTPPRPCY
jgi:hypothetical protein